MRPQISHRLKVFENILLERIFGPVKEEVKGDWKKTAK
jgi:hypothetical protein